MMIDGVSGAGSVSSSPDVQYDSVSYQSQVKQSETKPVDALKKSDAEKDKDGSEAKGVNGEQKKKQPSVTSIDSAVSSANNKMTKTRCEYSYDDKTNRVSIKVYDKESDELIREVPSEESLEMFQKLLDLAGMMVDEKR